MWFWCCFCSCTVISFHVERLMRIPVEVVRGSQSEEEKAMRLARIPLSCYGEDPLNGFLCGRNRKGYSEWSWWLIQKKCGRSKRQRIWRWSRNNWMMTACRFRSCGGPCIPWRTATCCGRSGGRGRAGCSPEVNAEQLQELKKQLPGMAVCLFVLLAFMALGTWNLFHLQSRAYKRGLAGAVIILACLGIFVGRSLDP